MDLLTKISEAQRSLGLLHNDIEKISGKIEAATSEYKANQEKEKTAPVVTAILRRPQSEVDEDNARATRHEARDANRLRVETWGIAIGAIVAVATLGQLMLTSRAVRIAAISANAAQQSVASNVANFHTEQRAWLDILPITTIFDAKQAFKSQVVIKNAGKTPAKNVVYGWRLDGATKETMPKLDFDQDMVEVSLGILPPEGQMVQVVTPPDGQILGQPKYEAIDRGVLAAFFYGRVKYDDVFNCHHWIKFCYVFNPRRKIFDLCDVHNSMDEETKEPCHGN